MYKITAQDCIWPSHKLPEYHLHFKGLMAPGLARGTWHGGKDVKFVLPQHFQWITPFKMLFSLENKIQIFTSGFSKLSSFLKLWPAVFPASHFWFKFDLRHCCDEPEHLIRDIFIWPNEVIILLLHYNYQGNFHLGIIIFIEWRILSFTWVLHFYCFWKCHKYILRYLQRKFSFTNMCLKELSHNSVGQASFIHCY